MKNRWIWIGTFALLLFTCLVILFTTTQGKRRVSGAEGDPPMDKVGLYKTVSPAAIEVFENKKFRGSGFIACGKEKLAVTALHVVGNIAPDDISIRLSDGTTVKVSAVGKDEEQHIAILQFSKSSDPPCLPLADYGQLKVGHDIMLVGSQIGLTGTPAWGTITGLNRTIQNSKFELPEDFLCKRCTDMISVDIRTNSGNSGGPAVNSKGEVIGADILTMRFHDNDPGIPFLISSKSIGKALTDFSRNKEAE